MHIAVVFWGGGGESGSDGESGECFPVRVSVWTLDLASLLALAYFLPQNLGLRNQE